MRSRSTQNNDTHKTESVGHKIQSGPDQYRNSVSHRIENGLDLQKMGSDRIESRI